MVHCVTYAGGVCTRGWYKELLEKMATDTIVLSNSLLSSPGGSDANRPIQLVITVPLGIRLRDWLSSYKIGNLWPLTLRLNGFFTRLKVTIDCLTKLWQPSYKIAAL